MHPSLLIGSILDALGIAALVTDPARCATRETARFGAMMTEEPEHARIRAELGDLVSQLGTHSYTSRASTRVLRTRSASYTLGAVRATEWGAGAVCVAWVARAEGPEQCDSDPFRLTPRELEVARSIALGASSREIASALGISVHTARRHTERVFDKLGVKTRASVGAVLLSARSM
jgi:DNA-binding CsgD family transcriptional regulator